MSDEELARWILDLTSNKNRIGARRRHYNFDDQTDVQKDDYQNLVGFSKIQFNSLLTEISDHVHNSVNRNVRNALAIFLMLLRHNLSQKVLSSLFGIPNQSCVSETIEAVATALDNHFVKKYLGFEHLSREAALRDHSRPIYSKLFKEEDPTKLFLIMDGTYIYIEKPADFQLQKLTYSGQKKRNLIKPFMIVLPSGYILTACGPYYANGANNDAGILKSILSELPPDSPYLKPGDHHILDRGFRDVIQTLLRLGHLTHMPELLDTDDKQFTTSQGNESRRVTLVRWLVEAVNGRIKKKFKLFRETVPGGYLEKLPMLFRIGCALINCFYPPLSTHSPKHDKIAERALELVDQENALQKRVEDEKMDRRTKQWKTASLEEFKKFPKLSVEDLEDITLGVYQIGLAKRYAHLHMSNSEKFEIKLNSEFTNIVRAKIESRFTANKAHDLWIEYSLEVQGADAIKGFYCKCKQGARTMGCCAHICTVLWYLGYQRYQNPTILKVRKRKLEIINAGES
ncbi:uncharacterized protein LOC118434065 [Folsomia candida]|uniref:uncharacterized protein LOC118434065 n=1 Tax=Folsomia candida TaxID=158441 RepID=UPI001604C671|nr:uncharacterized protein LOC118434065 [Folsomia candida]